MGHLRGSCGTDCCDVGAVAPWIIYAIIAVPMIAMLFDRKIDADPLIRWVLFALIALTAILPTRFS